VVDGGWRGEERGDLFGERERGNYIPFSGKIM